VFLKILMPHLKNVVIEVLFDEIHLKFLRFQRTSVYTLPLVVDESWEPLASVSLIIPQPVLDKRGHYIFPDDSDPL
jgi:hypothetical protein